MTEAFWNRDDFDEMTAMRREMERFFSHMPRWKKPSAVFEKAWKPLCDVYECPDCFVVVMELAGVDEEQVEVTLRGRLLTIRGRRQPIRPPGVRKTYLLEVNYGEFERNLELPTDIDADATQAVYRQGFLEITLPKRKEERPRNLDASSE